MNILSYEIAFFCMNQWKILGLLHRSTNISKIIDQDISFGGINSIWVLSLMKVEIHLQWGSFDRRTP